jgi:hypothetical protein
LAVGGRLLAVGFVTIDTWQPSISNNQHPASSIQHPTPNNQQSTTNNPTPRIKENKLAKQIIPQKGCSTQNKSGSHFTDDPHLRMLCCV